MADNFLIQAGFEIHFNPEQDVTFTDEGWLEAGAGIATMDPSGNDVLDQTPYYNGGGNTTTDVVGGQDVFPYSGHRDYDDDFQNYVFNIAKYQKGKGRRGTFRIVHPDGLTVLSDCTLANIEGPGGDANNKGNISFEVHLNGKPDVTQPPTQQS